MWTNALHTTPHSIQSQLWSCKPTIRRIVTWQYIDRVVYMKQIYQAGWWSNFADCIIKKIETKDIWGHYFSEGTYNQNHQWEGSEHANCEQA